MFVPAPLTIPALPWPRLTLPRGAAAQVPCSCGRRGALVMIDCKFGVCGTCCSERQWTDGKLFCQPHHDREEEKKSKTRLERGGRRSSSSTSWTWS
jgi:hypothetical protein